MLWTFVFLITDWILEFGVGPRMSAVWMRYNWSPKWHLSSDNRWLLLPSGSWRTDLWSLSSRLLWILVGWLPRYALSLPVQISTKKCLQLKNYHLLHSKNEIECEPCDKPGHICDPDTGRCVCPTGTEGPKCQSCSAGTWGYHSVKGCKVHYEKEHCCTSRYRFKSLTLNTGVQLSFTRLTFQPMWSVHRNLSV